MKLCGEGVVEKDDNEEIKGIERPAKETAATACPERDGLGMQWLY